MSNNMPNDKVNKEIITAQDESKSTSKEEMEIDSKVSVLQTHRSAAQGLNELFLI